MEEQLLKYRELEYLARYGDYLSIIPKKIRFHASHQKIDNCETVSGKYYWTDIAKILEKEDEEQAEATRKEAKLVPSPVRIAILRACTNLGIIEYQALWSIKEYAKRNETMYDLQEMREDGKFASLAETLHADLHDLDLVFTKPETDMDHLRSIIKDEINRWFDDAEEDPDNPQAWTSSQELRQVFKNKKSKAGKKSNEGAKQKDVASANLAPEGQATYQNEKSLGGMSILSSKKGKERIASTEVPRGSEEEKEKRIKYRREIGIKATKLEDRLRELQEEMADLDEANPDEADLDNAESSLNK